MPCRQAWCGPCYGATDGGEFPIAIPVDEEGVEIEDHKDRGRYLAARNGDHLITPFQCDLCHFRNMTDRDPQELLPMDNRLLKCIRRANLDALWATEPDTVSKNLSELRRGAGIAASLGIHKKMFRPMGPYPVDDSFGMSAAIVMLQLSLNPGKNDKNVQFNTIRRFRSSYANVYQASSVALEGTVLAKDTRKLAVTKCPSHGNWFERFAKGCHRRMGDCSIPDRALGIDILVEMFRILEAEWLKSGYNSFELAMEGALYIIGFCCALRGEEMPKADLFGTQTHFESSGKYNPPHVVVALIGRFKGESGTRYHLMPLVEKTRSGLEPRKWIGRLIECYKERNITHGPLFRGKDNAKMAQREMTQIFHRRLIEVQRTRSDLISEDVDIEEVYNVSRSFRRGSTSRAIDRGLPPEVSEANNRWRKFERAKAAEPSLSMREKYTDVKLAVNSLLRYSQEM